MSTAYEDGKAALDQLIDWYGEHADDLNRNEATTRFHLVDTIVREVLRWPSEEVVTEESHEGKFFDYSLGRPAVRMIIEAKRESRYFQLPVGMTSLVQRLSSLTDAPDGREVKRALQQVIGYCASRGVQLAVVCNGTQVIAFLGVRTDGTAPLDGTALIFTSLSAMRENFHLLWSNLSRPGVEARNLFVTLREAEIPTAPPPLSASIPHYPGHKRRNDIQTGLQILADLFLEDITRDPTLQEEFLRETYATSGALSQYALVSREILENRYSVLHESDANLEPEPVLTKKGMKSEVNPNLRSDILASSISRRPIILLGDVGVGKTMFIRRLIHVDAKDVFERSIVAYVDFGSQTTLMADLGAFVVAQIEEQLLTNYDIDIQERSFVEAVYRKELKRFDGTVFGELKEFDESGYRRERLNYLARLLEDKEAHVRASLNHIRATHRRQVVIFLDNIDQWDSAFQERVFLMSVTLAQEWPATVFVSIRPDTFYRSRAEGTLAAYQPRAFTIAPPRIDVVLKKRLQFALNQLRDTSRLDSFPAGVTVSSDSLVAYLEVLFDNFENNERLNSLIDNLAAGNVRRALEFVSRFIGSGHVDTRKILGIYEREGDYTIGLHEFIRAIIYGDSEHYDPDVSPIANMFSISQPDGREHFLLGLLVAHIELAGDRKGAEGFTPADEVYAFGQKCGFSPDQVAWAVDRGVKKGLIERSPRGRGSATHEHLRVTSAGVYTARMLVHMFAYVDAVVVDTPIVDPNYRRLISAVQDISERLRRAEVFRLYLDRQWRLLKSEPEDLPFDWDEHSRRLSREVDYVNRKNQT